jgi:hypothetical protein
MWILKNSKDMLEYLNLGSSPPATALKDLASLLSTKLLRELVQLFFIKRMANVDTNALY